MKEKVQTPDPSLTEAAAGAREARVERMGGWMIEAEGSIAREIREGGWVPPRTAGLCFDRLQAAQLRLVLGFFQSARLSEGCALVAASRPSRSV